MLKQIVLILSYANIASLLVPLGIGLINWRNLSSGLRAGWGGIAFYFLFFLISLSLVFLKSGLNTLLINYLISAVFGGAFALAYWLILPKDWHRTLIAILGIAGILGIVTEAFILGHYQEVSRWSVPAQTVLTTIIVLIYLTYLIPKTKVSLLKLPFFWLSIALLTSSVLGTIYDVLQHQLMTSSREWLMIWMSFQLGVTILCNLIYGLGFSKAKQTIA